MTSLTFLGTGNFQAPVDTALSSAAGPKGIARPGTGTIRYWNGFLLGGTVLVEVPPTALPHLRRCGVEVTEIDTVMISHFHPDHTFGWPFLLNEMVHLGRTRPLHLAGPPGIEAFLHQMMLLGSLSRVEQEARDAFEIHFVEADGSPQSAGAVRFRGVEVDHVAELTCLGYLFDLPLDGARAEPPGTGGGVAGSGATRAVSGTAEARDRRRIAYSGDTSPCAGLEELAGDADTLVLECNGLHSSRSHMSLSEATELHERFPELRIVLTHLGPEVAGEAPSSLMVPDDFETLEL